MSQKITSLSRLLHWRIGLDRVEQRFGKPFAPHRYYHWLASGTLPFSIECLAESGNIYPVQSPLFFKTVSPHEFAEVAAGRAHLYIAQHRHSDGALIWGPSPDPDDPLTTCTILVDEERLNALCEAKQPSDGTEGDPPERQLMVLECLEQLVKDDARFSQCRTKLDFLRVETIATLKTLVGRKRWTNACKRRGKAYRPPGRETIGRAMNRLPVA